MPHFAAIQLGLHRFSEGAHLAVVPSILNSNLNSTYSRRCYRFGETCEENERPNPLLHGLFLDHDIIFYF